MAAVVLLASCKTVPAPKLRGAADQSTDSSLHDEGLSKLAQVDALARRGLGIKARETAHRFWVADPTDFDAELAYVQSLSFGDLGREHAPTAPWTLLAEVLALFGDEAPLLVAYHRLSLLERDIHGRLKWGDEFAGDEAAFINFVSVGGAEVYGSWVFDRLFTTLIAVGHYELLLGLIPEQMDLPRAKLLGVAATALSQGVEAARALALKWAPDAAGPLLAHSAIFASSSNRMELVQPLLEAAEQLEAKPAWADDWIRTAKLQLTVPKPKISSARQVASEFAKTVCGGQLHAPTFATMVARSPERSEMLTYQRFMLPSLQRWNFDACQLSRHWDLRDATVSGDVETGYRVTMSAPKSHPIFVTADEETGVGRVVSILTNASSLAHEAHLHFAAGRLPQAKRWGRWALDTTRRDPRTGSARKWLQDDQTILYGLARLALYEASSVEPWVVDALDKARSDPDVQAKLEAEEAYFEALVLRRDNVAAKTWWSSHPQSHFRVALLSKALKVALRDDDKAFMEEILNGRFELASDDQVRFLWAAALFRSRGPAAFDAFLRKASWNDPGLEILRRVVGYVGAGAAVPELNPQDRKRINPMFWRTTNALLALEAGEYAQAKRLLHGIPLFRELVPQDPTFDLGVARYNHVLGETEIARSIYARLTKAYREDRFFESYLAQLWLKEIDAETPGASLR